LSFGARGKTKKKKGGNLNENKVEKSNKCDTCDYAMPTHDPDDPGTTPHADNPPTDDDGGLGTGAIVGIILGGIAFLSIAGFALAWFVIKKKSFADLISVFKKN
jgi:hypothetical protein